MSRFVAELPEWNNPGSRPSSAVIDEGWKINDRPPAAWFNWAWNRVYECLDEIRTTLDRDYAEKKSVPLFTATLSGSTYIVTTPEPAESLVDGMTMNIVIDGDSVDNATLDLDGLGAKNLVYDYDKNVLVKTLQTGRIYNIVYRNNKWHVTNIVNKIERPVLFVGDINQMLYDGYFVMASPFSDGRIAPGDFAFVTSTTFVYSGNSYIRQVVTAVLQGASWVRILNKSNGSVIKDWTEEHGIAYTTKNIDIIKSMSGSGLIANISGLNVTIQPGYVYSEGWLYEKLSSQTIDMTSQANGTINIAIALSGNCVAYTGTKPAGYGPVIATVQKSGATLSNLVRLVTAITLKDGIQATTPSISSNDSTVATTKFVKDVIDQIVVPIPPVTSVNGKVGEVILNKSDIGLGNVENYGVATQEEAEAGVVNDKYMTPLRVKQATAEVSIVAKVYEESSSSTTARTVTIPNIIGYSQMQGKIFWIKSKAVGSDAATTLNVNGLGAKSLQFPSISGAGLASTPGFSNWVRDGGIYGVLYDGTNFVVVNAAYQEASDSQRGIIKVANNLTTTTAGFALDARQGKTLNDAIAAIDVKNNTIYSSYATYSMYDENVSLNWTASIPGITSYSQMAGKVWWLSLSVIDNTEMGFDVVLVPRVGEYYPVQVRININSIGNRDIIYAGFFSECLLFDGCRFGLAFDSANDRFVVVAGYDIKTQPAPYVKTFSPSDWILTGDHYELAIPAEVHQKGTEFTITVYRLEGGVYVTSIAGMYTDFWWKVTVSTGGLVTVLSSSNFSGKVVLV